RKRAYLVIGLRFFLPHLRLQIVVVSAIGADMIHRIHMTCKPDVARFEVERKGFAGLDTSGYQCYMLNAVGFTGEGECAVYGNGAEGVGGQLTAMCYYQVDAVVAGAFQRAVYLV